MTSNVVIVGAGHGGVTLCATLRSLGFVGNISLLSDEAELPYHRPPLSKGFIANDAADADARLLLEPGTFYQDHAIDLRLNTQVIAVSPQTNSVQLADGSTLPYDHLIMATGSRARTLCLPGSELDNILVLRTQAQARHLRERLAQSQSVVIVGGGFIGLEVAATARKRGLQVTVLEGATRLMERSVSATVSEHIAERYRAQGITLALDSSVQAFEGDNGQVAAVLSATGRYPADLVLVGAGALPNSELAEAAGIACVNGILVDSQMRTSSANVYAIGDCVSFENRYAGHVRLRLESIQNANDQARLVARLICGEQAHYDAVPWFWSDLGEIKLQMVGLAQGRTQSVTRGEPANGRFSVLHYRNEQLIAVDSINQPIEHILARKLLAAGRSPSFSQAADITYDLKNLL